jgi:hypothetical protein
LNLFSLVHSTVFAVILSMPLTFQK